MEHSPGKQAESCLRWRWRAWELLPNGLNRDPPIIRPFKRRTRRVILNMATGTACSTASVRIRGHDTQWPPDTQTPNTYTAAAAARVRGERKLRWCRLKRNRGQWSTGRSQCGDFLETRLDLSQMNVEDTCHHSSLILQFHTLLRSLGHLLMSQGQ